MGQIRVPPGFSNGTRKAKLDELQYRENFNNIFRTLVDSSVERRRGHAGGRHSDPENDDTLADSIIDSMHSCADTLVGNGDDGDDATLHSCADTLHDSDEEFFSEQVFISPS